MDTTEHRIRRLETGLSELEARLSRLEAPTAAAPGLPARPQAPRAPETTGQAPRPPAARPARPPATPAAAPPPAARRAFELAHDDLEDLFGGRVLAWVGGLSVLLGVVFLFALAISNGWIGETARVLLGAAGSTGLLAFGAWLHERRARTDAALASVATGIAGLFTCVTVAAQMYDLIPQLPAAVIAIAVGAAATVLAVRWESRGIAALGILGALCAPFLTGVAGQGGTMVLLLVALASAAGVLLWLRWDWLALAAFVVATPQWAAYALTENSVLAQLAVLISFGALGVAIAVGHELRVKAERLRSSSAYLLALNAVVVSGVGWYALANAGADGAAKAWLVAVALVHLGVGLAGGRLRLSDDIRLLALTIGAVTADVAFGLVADGPALAMGWAVSGVGFAALTRHPGVALNREATALTQAGLGGHLALALISAVSVSDPVHVLHGNAALTIAGAASVAAVAAGCLVSARIAAEREEAWRVVLDSVGLASVAVLTALTLDGVQLVLAWALEAAALGAVAKRTDDAVAFVGALGFICVAGIHAFAIEAPPVSLVTGLAEPAAAVAAVAAIAAVLVLIAGWAGEEAPELRLTLRLAAAVVLLYLASTAVVTPFESDSAVDSALLSAHQQGQMVLSVFWGFVGLGTIVVGLRRNFGAVRIAGLILLGVTVGKLFLFDLATLTSIYRVVAFVGLGLLLLGGALVWQRLRPRALPDLRDTPVGLR